MSWRRGRAGQVCLLLVYLLLAGFCHIGRARRFVYAGLCHDVSTINATEHDENAGACNQCPTREFPHCLLPSAAGVAHRKCQVRRAISCIAGFANGSQCVGIEATDGLAEPSRAGP